MAKYLKPMTSVIIKDEVDVVLFRKDFYYQDVGSDYFDFLAYKTNASLIEFHFSDTQGQISKSWRLQLIYDLENKFKEYAKQREMFIQAL